MTVVTTGGSRNEFIEDVIATRCAYWDSLFAQASSQRRLASEACGFRLLTETTLQLLPTWQSRSSTIDRLERGIRQEEPTIKHIFIEAESLRAKASQHASA